MKLVVASPVTRCDRGPNEGSCLSVARCDGGPGKASCLPVASCEGGLVKLVVYL